MGKKSLESIREDCFKSEEKLRGSYDSQRQP